MEWQKIALFISSTFDDMHAERDYLIKEVFPELEDWAEKRKIRLTEVDLRWGITEVESKNNGTVSTCLRNIDKCRPFFICFLGQRIGWIPDYDKDINIETKFEYPTIKDIISNNSLTEIEIQHSLFSPLPQRVDNKIIQYPPTKYNLFFFRKDDYLNELTDAQKNIYSNITHKSIKKLNNLKNQILNKKSDETIYIKVNEYSGKWDQNLKLPELSHYPDCVDKGRLIDFKCNGENLKDILINELKEQIRLEFPENKPIQYKSKIEEDIDQQDIFIYKNNEDYIDRSNYLSIIKDYLENNDNLPLIISSPSGYGKTMLLSKLVKDFKEEHPNKKLFKRFCGKSRFNLDICLLWKSILNEMGVDDTSNICLNDYGDLKNNFKQMLNILAKKDECVIIIDSINHVSNGIDMLNWNFRLPNNLKLIISISENDYIVRQNVSKSSIFLEELNDNEKKNLIKTYFGNYLKELDEKKIETICKTEGSKNPLFLKILLTELRVFGSFNQLETKIKKFGSTPENAFNHVLERLEEDEKLKGKEKIIPLLFGLLSNVSDGLTEKELIRLIKNKTNLNEKYIQDTIRIFLRQVRPFMVKKEGKHDFFYENFKNAAKKRYNVPNKI